MIKLTGTNADKVSALLDSVQTRSRERNITVKDINAELESVIKHLGITKKALEGTVVTINANAQNFPRCYSGTPAATFFQAKFHRGDWILLEIYRSKCTNKKALLTLSETAKTALIAVNSCY